MGLLTTTIGAYPKPEYVKLPDWFGNLDTSDPTRGWAEALNAMGDDINREKVRIIYENDEIGIEHSFVTFKDGNTQAVMGVFKYQDGKIISFETGATNMPK